jgi:hypothetical protein
MILNRWAKIWAAYQESSSSTLFSAVFHYRKVLEYWSIWCAAVAYGIGAWMSSFHEGWITAAGLGVVVLAYWFLFLSVEKALRREFAAEYRLHSLAAHPLGERRLYLRYALFLRSLATRNLAKDDIQAVSRFSRVAGSPAPVFSLSQHPAVVPVLTVLTGLTTELIKDTAAWKAGNGAGFVVMLGFGLVFLLAILDVLRGSKQKHAELKRFIKWAAMDIDEAK